jgi:serine/threonine protein kinase
MDERTDKRGLEHTYGANAVASVETEMLHSTHTSWSQPSTPLDEMSTDEQDLRAPGSLPDTIATIRSQCSDTADQPSSRQSMLQTPKFSRAFHSIKLLGAGGFSTVDEVRHQQTGLRVGRKTLKNRNQTALEELKKEVNVLQKLRHPHIIRFLGAYSKGDKMSILLSPVAETTLAVWLDRSALQQPANLLETIVKMFGCLSSSVRYLHEQRPVVKHMDIKPQNILIVEGDREFPHVILSDFGVSSAEDLSDDKSRPWTRQYIAPEVFEGFTRKQPADIWSLGCVFAEMASVPLSQGNAGWLAFSKVFNGRTGTYYWQDVPGIQKKLSAFLEEAKSSTEQVVVRTLQGMLSAQPDERPDAASLTMVFTPAPCCLNWPNDKMVFPGPHEELLEVEKFGKHHRIDGHAQSTLHDKDANDCAVSASIAKTWLDDCLCTHGACHHLGAGYSTDLPRRLIDILPEGQAANYVRIVKSDSLETTLQQVQYVAISHVWSHTEPLLSSESQSKMQTELGLETLSLAVRNAISEVQRLGFRYCWLDSLCVLQDSEQEKEQECTNMSSVFRNAVLTVVLDQLASVSTSKNAGSETETSGTTDKTQFASPLSSITGSSTIATRLPISALLPPDILTAPNLGWDTRAWALQDRLLSRRFLHLGEQSYWECNTLKASETFPRGLPALLWEKVHTQDELHAQNHNATLDSSYVVEINNNFAPGKIFSMEFDDAHNANTIPKPKPTEPRPPLPSASRLRNCQWIKKQGDDAGQGTEAVQATLNVHKTQGLIAYADSSSCTSCSSCSRSSRRHTREVSVCRNGNMAGKFVLANDDAGLVEENSGGVIDGSVQVTGLI